MKTKFSQFAPPVAMAAVLSIITLMGLFSCNVNSNHCTDPSYPYWCPSAQQCCPSGYPYDDEHGSCYQTMSGCASTGYQCEDCSGGNTSNKYDGAYSWSITFHGVSNSCNNCVFIKNGQISNTGGTFYGSISVDNFGNITFHGYCPEEVGGNPTCDATFTGKTGGQTFYSWFGGWTCCDGSHSVSGDQWSLFETQ